MMRYIYNIFVFLIDINTHTMSIDIQIDDMVVVDWGCGCICCSCVDLLLLLQFSVVFVMKSTTTTTTTRQYPKMFPHGGKLRIWTGRHISITRAPRRKKPQTKQNVYKSVKIIETYLSISLARTSVQMDSQSVRCNNG